MTRTVPALLLAGCAAEPEPVPAGDAWRPAPGTAWQWQLSGEPDIGVDVEMFDLDLFDAPQNAIDALRDRGVAVICYFSAGTREDWRADAGDYPEDALGAELEDWPGERWVDVRDEAVRDIVRARLDRAVERGCDGVEPDNVDAWDNGGGGLGITAEDQLDFNRFVADEAHARGLSVGLKNDLDQVDELLDWFDWALNEECVAYDECDLLAPFTESGRAAFHVEYVEDWADAPALAEEVCGVGPDLDTLVKTWDLGPERLACGE